jgi:hypothetical protein
MGDCGNFSVAKKFATEFVAKKMQQKICHRICDKNIYKFILPQ